MGFLDKAIDKLKTDSGKMEAKDQLLDFLKDAYLGESVTLAQLEKEAKFNPYDHLKDELNKIIREEKKHVKQIKEWIEEMNGAVPQVDIPESELSAYSTLGDIIKRKLEIYDDFAEIMNILDNNYLEDELLKLKKIKDEEKSHIDRLDDIMTKFNA
ncbi:MAG: hypothetical protein Kow00108_15840 [Calditrichia bacterium]